MWGRYNLTRHHWQHQDKVSMQLRFPHLCESILLRRLEVFGHQQPKTPTKMLAEKDISKVSHDVTFYRYQWNCLKGKISSICPDFFWRLPVEYTSLLENLKSKFRQEAISAPHPGAVCCLHFGPSMPHFSSSESDTSCVATEKMNILEPNKLEVWFRWCSISIGPPC